MGFVPKKKKDFFMGFKIKVVVSDYGVVMRLCCIVFELMNL